MKIAQVGLDTTTAPQAIQSLKNQIQDLTNINVSELPAKVQDLNNMVEQIETQVAQLEQMRAQLKQIQQTQTADDQGSEFWRKNYDYGEGHYSNLQRASSSKPISKRSK